MILDEIHNHYEKLVFNEVMRVQADKSSGYEESVLVDVVCVALNKLPARYLRHDVDFAYFLTDDERNDMDKKVAKAVKDAFELVAKNPSRES